MLFLAIIQHRRGNRNVWTKSVHEVDLFAPPDGGQPGMVHQPAVQQPLPHQAPVQYPDGTPSVQQQTAQPAANTGYTQDPEKA